MKQDYLIALQRRFGLKSERAETLKAELNTARELVHETLGAEQKKLLLRMIDLEDALRDEAALNGFIAGLRLERGISFELDELGQFSYEDEQEEHARQDFERKPHE